MQMIDVIQKLREIADRSPEEIGRAIATAEKMSGQPVAEASEAQKAAQEKFKAMIKGKKSDDKEDSKSESKGKKSDDKEDSKSESKGKKPDFLDVDKDGDKKEPMTKAMKDKEDTKESVSEDVQITLSGSDAVLAEILKLAGQIGAKTSGNPTPVSAAPRPSPMPSAAPVGVPSTGPLPSLDKMMGTISGSDMDGPMGGGMEDEMLGDSFDATTTPNPVVMGAGAAVPAGNDLAKPKITAPKVSGGDNPMHTSISFD